MNGDRLKISVFVDFDNIEIGVKSTLNRHFDIGVVLEAIKERGEVVTKVAYGDWKRAGDHSRSMTQHAIQMVQRNLTPGGDKNGADINLALDALEMAFTRNHINAFVIVGGDSDFIALVEKLKQYDKTVFVVGGRAFTSIILQKNCHEFIAYENLIAPQSRPRGPAEKTRSAGEGQSLSKTLPLVKRALKVLSEREVSPQLGLLKSTLLQLDSTFSERDYGASTFRDFIEKLAGAGYVNLKQVDRSLLVELKDSQVKSAEPEEEVMPSVAVQAEPAPQPQLQPQVAASATGPPAAQLPEQADEGIRAIQEVFQSPKIVPHWPMYLRNVKQFIKNAAPAFDERKFGFVSFLEAVRAASRAGVFRLERNRQGILRVYPGSLIPQAVPRPVILNADELSRETAVAESDEPMNRDVALMADDDSPGEEIPTVAAEVLDGGPPVTSPEPDEKPKRTRKAAAKKKPAPRGKFATTAAKRSRKKPAADEETA